MILSLLAFFLYLPAVEQNYPEGSIFWLESTWINQEGKKMKLKEFSGAPSIVSMVFLSCSYSCPLTVQDMREMELHLKKENVRDYHMVLISIDPEHDSPSAMKKFMKGRHLESGRWTILTSESENIREMAALLGFSYKKDGAMQFAHSMLTWVFDKNGELRFTRNARKQTNVETANALVTLTSQKQGAAQTKK